MTTTPVAARRCASAYREAPLMVHLARGLGTITTSPRIVDLPGDTRERLALDLGMTSPTAMVSDGVETVLVRQIGHQLSRFRRRIVALGPQQRLAPWSCPISGAPPYVPTRLTAFWAHRTKAEDLKDGRIFKGSASLHADLSTSAQLEDGVTQTALVRTDDNGLRDLRLRCSPQGSHLHRIVELNSPRKILPISPSFSTRRRDNKFCRNLREGCGGEPPFAAEGDRADRVALCGSVCNWMLSSKGQHHHERPSLKDPLMTARPRVLLLQSHPDDGYSMSRYSSHITRYYRSRDVDLQIARPINALSKRTKPRWKKHVAYIEKLILFPAQLILMRARVRPDIVHITDHSNAPWAWFLASKSRTLITVHDLIAQRAALDELPEHQPRRPGRIYQAIIASGLKKADDLISVSRATRVDAERLFPSPHHHVVYNFVDQLNKRLPRTHLDGHNILIVSTGGWRKTRWRAIEIAVRLALELDEGNKVVLVGPPLELNECHLIMQAGIDPDSIVVHSNLSEEGLLQQYAEAMCLVQASRYEGFAWPIVEANVAGVPVIASDEMIFHEVGSDARFVSDTSRLDWPSIAAWARSPRAITDAYQNAERFTFVRSAQAFDQILNISVI